jgi:hypothetical protein
MPKKTKLRIRELTLIAGVILLPFLFSQGGCSVSSDSSSSGSVSVDLTDAATESFRAIYVTIDEVQAHRRNGFWEVVAEPQQTYNLLELVNGVTENLGSRFVPAGTYSQMRLLLDNDPDEEANRFGDVHEYGNYLVLQGETEQRKLTVPSGLQTGIKLVSPFSVPEDGQVELLLDFDAARSVIQAGASDNWLLKPTIRVLNRTDLATLSGQVASEGRDADMNGTRLSAQWLDANANQETDRVQVRTATIARGLEESLNATYTLVTEPGEQVWVASKDGFVPAAKRADPSPGAEPSWEVELQNATMGYVNGTVSLNDDLLVTDFQTEFVRLSFRHRVEAVDTGQETWIELKQLQQADLVSQDGEFVWSFQASLPDMSQSPGDYRIVASLLQQEDDDEEPTLVDEAVENATLGQVLDFELQSF